VSRLGLLTLVFAASVAAMRLLLSPSEQAVQTYLRVTHVRKKKPTLTDLETEELRRPFSQRVLVPVFDSVSASMQRMLPGAMISRINTKLAEAGRPFGVERFVGMKVLASLAALLFYSTMVLPQMPHARRPLAVLYAALSMLIAFNLPDAWLTSRKEARERAVRKHLADVMDLLSVSVEAGLGFDGAIQKVAEKFKEPVSGEFKAYLAEVRLGKSRAESLRNLSRRVDVPEVRSFVASVIQADQLGVSISSVLRVQSESLRQLRRQRAEERAMQAPVKMLLPLVFCIFPTLFLVLLGPVAIQWLTSFRTLP